MKRENEETLNGFNKIKKNMGEAGIRVRSRIMGRTTSFRYIAKKHRFLLSKLSKGKKNEGKKRKDENKL